MKCPYCHHTFRLTWARYLKAPSGRHSCPSCRKTSRLQFRPLPLAILVVIGLACALPALPLLELWLGLWWGLLALIPAIAVVLPLDKLFDEHLRQLKPLEPEPPSDTAACAECGRVFNVGDMVAHGGRHVCARCKPVFLQKLAEGAATNPAPRRGRALVLGKRFLLLLLLVGVLAFLLALLFPISSKPPM